MTNHPNRSKFTAATRGFVTDYVRADRQWSTRTIEGYLPKGLRLRDGADYAGPATVADIASFMRDEAVEG